MDNNTLRRALKHIGTWLQFRYEQEDLPGFVVTIRHKNKVIFNEAYGYADLEQKYKMTSRHVFRMASHSKSFTATAIMQLQEQGKLRIDDPVATHLPWLKEHRDQRWQKVTIRQLLCHGAGVIRDGLDSDFWQLDRAFPSPEKFKAEILEADLVLDNNTKMKYSNFGFGVLGTVIEAASGQLYHEYITAHIIRPLHLQNTWPEYNKSLVSRLAVGYTSRNLDKQRLPIAPIETGALAGATGFCATTEDLGQFYAALLPGTGRLLTDESKKEMQHIHFPIKDSAGKTHDHYGLGLKVADINGRPVYGHGGAFPGHRSQALADPRTGLTITVAINAIDGPSEAILKGIYGAIDFFNDHPKASPALQRLEGLYANLWGMAWIIAGQGELFVAYPGTWQPLKEFDRLKHTDGTTFRIIKTDSIEAEDEKVHFNLARSTVTTVRYAGGTMWPLAAWRKKQQERSVVELHK